MDDFTYSLIAKSRDKWKSGKSGWLLFNPSAHLFNFVIQHTNL